MRLRPASAPLTALAVLASLTLGACDTTADRDEALPLRALSAGATTVLRADRDGLTDLFALSDSLTFERDLVRLQGVNEAYLDASSGDLALADAVVTGTFDVPSLTAALGGTPVVYRGVPTLRFGDDRLGGYAGLTAEALYLAATEAGVRAMLDRRDGAAPSLADNATVVRLARRLETSPFGLVLPSDAAVGAFLGDALGLTALGLPVAAAAVSLDALALGLPGGSVRGSAWLAPAAPYTPPTLIAVLKAAAFAAGSLPADDDVRAALLSLQFAAAEPDVRMGYTFPFDLSGVLASVLRTPAPPPPAL